MGKYIKIKQQNTDNSFYIYSNVLDLARLRYLIPNIPLPIQVAQIVGPGSAFIGRDATYWLSTTADRLQIGKCMTDILKVGVLDTRSTGCIISDIVLWISLAVILGVVLIRFFMALIFGWFISGRLGSIREETAEEIKMRREKVLQWEMNNAEHMHYPRTQSIASFNPSSSSYKLPYQDGTESIQSTPKFRLFPTTSRFSQPNSPRATPVSSPHLPYTLPEPNQYNFNFDLIHTFMVVTCYSEGEEGLRITLDSLTNTDYPSSHKMLLVICDGMITGSGNGASTPDIVLSMLKNDFVPRDQVKPASYVSIADGTKRHNMAKVYSGYYKYNDDPEKPGEIREDQQTVPMIVIVKCGSEAEANDKKAGNRGKRDSQVILMNTMQKVYYGERMCDLEYQFCKAIVKLTGNHPSRFEICLMVMYKISFTPFSV
jgi:chitin synthase